MVGRDIQEDAVVSGTPLKAHTRMKPAWVSSFYDVYQVLLVVKGLSLQEPLTPGYEVEVCDLCL